MILLQGIFSGLLNNHDTSLVDTQCYVSVILKKKQAGLLKTELTLSPPKTNIFVHGKNCTFSKKGLRHKGRCYSVCIDDTYKWISHILSRIIGPSNTATKIRVPILDTGHMA